MRRPLSLSSSSQSAPSQGCRRGPRHRQSRRCADEDELLRNATLVFTRAVDTPAAAIPAAVLMRATGIAVIPAASRTAHRYYGTGVVSARGARPDDWTPPAVIAFEGAIPLDLETPPIDLVLVAQTRAGSITLCRDDSSARRAHSIVPGRARARAPVRIDADLLAYMQFDDYFAGVTIDDWVVEDMTASNAVLYGRPYSTDDIVRGAGFFHVPRPHGCGGMPWRAISAR